MRSAAIRQQIESRTKQAFGKPVWPHLFRDCAVTELVDCAPDEIGIAPNLAHARFQEMVAARRRAAARGTPGA